MKLANTFLLATPQLRDPRFAGSLIIVVRHDHDGALGLIVNQPSTLRIKDVLLDLEIDTSSGLDALVLNGGPLRPEAGFVLHTGQPSWQSSVAVAENLCLTTSKDILHAIAHDEGVRRYLICLGHAGWERGQLEKEIEAGDWLTTPADPHLIFDEPVVRRYQQAASQIGVDTLWLADEIGHA